MTIPATWRLLLIAQTLASRNGKMRACTKTEKEKGNEREMREGERTGEIEL